MLVLRQMQTSNRRFGSADGLAIVAVVIWGSGISVSKIVIDHIDVLAFLAIRGVCAALLLFVALVALGHNLRVKKTDVGSLALLGGVGIGLTHIGFLFGLKFTLASHGSVLVAMGPVFAALMATWVGWEKPHAMTWCGFGVCLVGIWLLVRGGQADLDIRILLGDLCLLGSALCWAVHILIGKRLLLIYSPLKVLAYATAFSNFVVLPIGIRSVVTQNWKIVTLEGWFGLVFTVLLSLVVANLLWLKSIKEIGVTRTALYQYLVPVVGVAMALLLLKEHLTFHQATGAGVVLSGIALTVWSRTIRSLSQLQ